MISQPLPNFKTQFYQKEEVGRYDNIALNQRYNKTNFTAQRGTRLLGPEGSGYRAVLLEQLQPVDADGQLT